MHTPFSKPVLFLVFNRPDTTAVVFEAIRAARPLRLYIAADGPRSGKAGEAEKCQATRAFAGQVDWPCEVKTLFRNENLGCRGAVSSAIDWFFEQEEEGVILEDDCVPHPDFFPFMESMLDRYRNNERVMHIGGANFQDGKQRGDAAYYFSRYNHIWGWASWRRAWKHYDVNLNGFSATEVERVLAPYQIPAREFNLWLQTLTRVAAHQINTWDYQWGYAIWKQGGCSIVPNQNLVSNIGFRADGTHTVSNDILGLAERPTHPLGELTHPASIAIDHLADRYTFTHYTSPGKLYFLYRKYFHWLLKKIGLS